MGKDGNKRIQNKKVRANQKDMRSNVSQFVPRKTKGVTYNPNKETREIRTNKKSTSPKSLNIEYFNNTKQEPERKRRTVAKPVVARPKSVVSRPKGFVSRPKGDIPVRTTNPNTAYKENRNKKRTSTQKKGKGRQVPKQVIYYDSERKQSVALAKKNPSQRIKKPKEKKVLTPEMKQQRRERAKRAFGIVFSIFLISAFLAGTYIASNFVFKVENITVSGNTKYESDYIIRLSGLNIGDNLLFLNANTAIKGLSQNPYINAKIIKQFPNRISIDITERAECAVIVTKSGYASIDSDGNVLAIEDIDRLPELLKIRGMESCNLQLGKRIAYDTDYRAYALLLLISEIVAGEHCTLISEINISNPLSVKLLTVAGFEVYFGDTEDIGKKFENLEVVLNKIKQNGFTDGKIDVSCIDKPAFIPSLSPSPSPSPEFNTELPEQTPTPIQTPDEMPENTPEKTPEQTPDENPEETMENTPEQTPEESP